MTGAVLPAAAGITGAAYLNAPQFSAGFRTAVLISAALCVVGGAVAAVTIRNPSAAAAARARPVRGELHCGLDAPPLQDLRQGARPQAQPIR